MRVSRARYFGLGSTRVVSLAEARGLAAGARQELEQGKDPIEARKQAGEADRRAGAHAITFKDCAEALMNSHEPSWKNPKHRQQWRNTLTTHVYPKLGHLAVSAIITDHVLEVLQPIWTRTPETASRVRGRIESVLDLAKARGARTGENPARWRGHLSTLLPKTSKIARVKHHAALPFIEIASFRADLRAFDGLAPRALEIIILTAARTSEALDARWTEFDLAQSLWVIPGERMKAGREHRVPLSARAVAILTELFTLRQNEFVFPGFKPGRPLSNMALLMLLRRMNRPDITVHGFRSTFRDWAAETTNFPNHVVEAALAHTVADKVEGAYRRGELFGKRRKLMDAWAASGEKKVANVLALTRRP